MKKNRSIAAALYLCLTALSPAATLTFDFGDASQTTSGINNFTPSTLVITDPIIDGGGTLGGVSMTLEGVSGANGTGTQSPTAASNLAGFSVQTTRDSLYGNTEVFQGNSNPLMTLTITGLDASGATQYAFEFAASRTGVSDNRTTQYGVAGLNSSTVSLNAANNTSETVSTTNITPTAAGNIVISIQEGAGNDNANSFYYINGMRITTVPEPGTALLSLSALGLFLRRRR